MKAMNENGTVVQVKIKKIDSTTTTNGGGRCHRHNDSTSGKSQWETFSDPIICRISPTLTAGKLRTMLGKCVASQGALKLGLSDLGQQESATMGQVALSYENDS